MVSPNNLKLVPILDILVLALLHSPIRTDEGKKIYYMTIKSDETSIGIVSFNLYGDSKPCNLYIRDLVISPNYQKMGYGSEIVNRLKQLAGEYNSRIIRCEADGDSPKFWEKHGFVSINELAPSGNPIMEVIIS